MTEQFNVIDRFHSVHGRNRLQRRVTTDDRGLSRSNTSAHGPRLGVDPSWRMSLPTVPSQTAINHMYDFPETQIDEGPTINPQQLHMEDSIDSLDSPFVENFEWMGGFNLQMPAIGFSDPPLNATSPSGFSLDSPIPVVVDNGYNHAYLAPTQHLAWQPGPLQLQTPDTTHMTPDLMGHMSNDYGLPVEYGMSLDIPTPMHQQSGIEAFYPTPPPFSSLSPDVSNATFSPHFQQPMTFHHDPAAFNGDGTVAFTLPTYSGRPAAVESMTEVTRQALLVSLSQSSTYGQRIVPHSGQNTATSARESSCSSTLPSLPDLQRFVSAYIQYFQPHYPFLHVPTLTFDSPSYTDNLRITHGYANGQGGIHGGGGCLILAMAAIGAQYELEQSVAKGLFDSARKMIQLYLEERRKADLAAAINSSRHNDNTAQNTPLWLVQAMLLNVIYGHQCGDKVSGDIASTHCAALVSLGRAADLLSPSMESNGQLPTPRFTNGHHSPDPETSRPHDSAPAIDPWGFNVSSNEDQMAWRRWAVAEERKRTLYAIFNMSSLLVSGYNHAPAIMNSEVHLDLPCEEELWTAESASIWNARGGEQAAIHRSISFASALSRLLMASQSDTHQNAMHESGQFGSSMLLTDLPPSELQPSTFGCLILLLAIHNFVWETRQRHAGIRWTTQESESMQAHVEPALRAWQAAWASNPTHSLERPNPFGMGPLSADSIPLLDLIYVRLYVNLGLSKEAFWSRDFDAMAEELARGTDIVQHADYPRSQSSHSSESGSRKASLISSTEGQDIHSPLQSTQQAEQKASRRERQLRKAAFYAADSLSMSQKLGVTFADFTSRDLPMQSAMVFFDCAQVLAEWATTVQERVGSYLGMMGRDAIDFTHVPAILLLEDEDCKLLEKTRDILAHAEIKMTAELGNYDPGAAMTVMSALPGYSNRGFGPQLLGVASYMLRRGAVWPGKSCKSNGSVAILISSTVTSLMARGLDVQAGHMQKRAEHSVAISHA